MAGLNKVQIIGFLGREPELKYTNAGNPVCRLSVGTTRVWKNKQTQEKQEETEWHRVVVWGQQAEYCNNFLDKGSMVYVEGRLRTSSYEQDGVKKWSTEIVSESVQFLDRKNRDGEGGGGSGGGSGGGGRKSGGNEKPPENSGGGGEDFDDDDDIPF